MSTMNLSSRLTKKIIASKPVLEKTALAAALTPFLSWAAPAMSQGFTLEEVVVTAQKREQSLQDVGVSVTAFSGDQMRELGQVNAKDVAAQTPGVNFADAGQSMTNILNIRGVSQNDFNPNQESPNAIYIDQAYLSILPASNFSIFDMERIEVLRGPQGTLYGRNATGGLIHYVTAKPTEELEGFVDVTLGEEGKERIEAAISGTITDGVRGRLSGVTDKNDGWMNNSAGDDLAESDTHALRGKLEIDVSEDSFLELAVSYGSGEKNQAYGHNPSDFDMTTGLEIPTQGIDFYGLGVAGGDSTGYRDPSNDPEDIEVDGASFYEPELTSYNAIYTKDFDGFTLTSVTNYVDWEVEYSEDSDASPRDGIAQIIDSETQQFSQEFRLDGETESMRWLAGVYYLDIDHSTEFTTRGEIGYLDDLFAVLGLTSLADIDGDATFGQTFGLYDDVVSDFDQDTQSIALFGQVEMDLTDDLKLTAGLRWTEDEKDFDYSSREFYAGAETTGTINEIWTTSNFDDSQKEEDWSGKFQLDYFVTGDTLVYAGVSKGIKGGGFNAPTSGGSVSEFEQETLYSFEAGMKTELSENARLNMSVFYYDYQDYQAFSFLNLVPTIDNKDATVTGAELELTWHPADGLDILLGASILDGEIEDMTLPGGQVVDTDLPMAGDFTYNALVRKGWMLGDNELSVQVDYSYTDDYFSDALNTPSGEVDGYGTANARIGFGPSDGQWEFALNVRNLTDEDEQVYHFPTGLGWSLGAVQQPRWVSAQFIYRLN
ncbi:TonB-dependent receptor [Aestuariicella sp. G3-2]|uniref:TonB-dependent receptor n=1 Tax=Pseudomaricurvus albidus TaxID=2842452 RepID=UPI001C0D4EF9|nr:TonB-dependent receptor [Aestuariicella albida]MBU3071751.1 TonB-dependent receptor [Aestuariicella albida]